MIHFRYFCNHLFLLFCLILVANGLYAQSGNNTAGGQAFSSSGKVDYTIGQIAYSNYTSSSCKINEGIQQPYEIFLLKTDNSSSYELPRVFPLPATDQVTIQFDKAISSTYYELIDLSGNILISNHIEDQQTRISLSDLIGNMYILKVYKNSKPISSFKLIKINKS